VLIDVHVHLGLKLQPRPPLPPADLFVLNPAYKYACDCCVDGFYQQYQIMRDYPRLGIYNPKCRVPPEVEVYRQIERGVVGLVLNPVNHSFSLLDERVERVVRILEKEDLPLLVYTGKGYGRPYYLRKFLNRVPYLILLGSGYPDYVNEALELFREDKVLFETSRVPPEVSLLFKGKRVFGSCYPYVELDYGRRVTSLELTDEEKYKNAVMTLRLWRFLKGSP
jgi:predicted TIM-barrel fold metal-dependent hydrolase